MTRILLTTTSFQDAPGPHHDLIAAAGYEIVAARGPLREAEMLALAGDVDAFLCGDDEITRSVLEKALPRLKVVSKYGIGLDKVDLAAAKDLGVPVTFCPGVNHATVAEHYFLLMLAMSRHLTEHATLTRAGSWTRLIGHELAGKTLGIVGLGRIGKEIAIRARAFQMQTLAFDPFCDESFAVAHDVSRSPTLEALLAAADIVALSTSLTPSTRGLLNRDKLALMRPGALLVNCARGELVSTTDVAHALAAGRLGGYGTDVLDQEPPSGDHPLLNAPNCLVTPHIGSRTHESIQRQAAMAATNLIRVLRGEEPLALYRP